MASPNLKLSLKYDKSYEIELMFKRYFLNLFLKAVNDSSSFNESGKLFQRLGAFVFIRLEPMTVVALLDIRLFACLVLTPVTESTVLK